MPVSRTVNRRPTSPSGAGSPATSTRTTTSPGVGELDGVADQVEQDLPQPAGVADQGVGHLRLHVVDQLQPFPVGPHGQGPQGVADRRPQGEVGHVQLELAGLDLGEVEQVVDHAEQVVGGRLDRLEVLPLVLGQGRVEGQLGHAEDGVHGGADLVADVGQELVLGPVRRLRRASACFRHPLTSIGHNRRTRRRALIHLSSMACATMWTDLTAPSGIRKSHVRNLTSVPSRNARSRVCCTKVAVVRMNSLEDPLEGRLGRSVEANDSIGFV